MTNNMNIIGNRKIFLSISGVLALASFLAIGIFGLKPGIDFSGGTMWQIKLALSDTRQISSDELKNFFQTDLKTEDVVIFPAENRSFIVRLPHISEDEHQQYFSALKNKFGGMEELSFQNIGPAIGEELRTGAFWAITMVLLGISLYIAFAFRKVSYPIKSWKYGIITLVTLLHDITIPAGLLAVLGKYSGIEIDTNFMVALLVIMGFSVHDTIVVFDRIRENLMFQKGKFDLAEIINNSVNQTFVRSVNTSLTLVLILLMMFFFGPITLKYFILTILVGVVTGTYSSIFIASPLLLIFHSKENR
ncbi:protein translocase subunit SecF [Candidatus Wolfebacteria bacterium]|uniref:Protein-export membrane protein SecF n=2 Tax=Parcubacteria group TaxID=1794811 RepID=A0A2M7H168_9BACT|nr:protein translocase subunit SecF [Candidatus Wolfebacteria bacterium]NCO44765.1 protein translocase subunit SecF [Candidatus Wolfebacteria bacterium]PIW34922.1 MAG: protein translocase subunit SecF [Candidatus Nealsonbacteria bacterium CG15_BIG_FIL_POST_REV_8_21_14_020_37_12]PIZ44910.1 MAG: protein translocase subunit SecF [Candidatus Wolfebacteria bacterium CG_4_10_14_0_2_um_filter_39_18]